VTETRLRGQEVTARIAVGNEVQAAITAIRDLSIQIDMEQLSEGYLGETTDRKDDIVSGASGSFTVDVEDQTHFLLIDTIKQRAQRRIPVNETRINLTARFTLPNGQTPRALVRDMKFGPLPLNVGSRRDYVNTSFDFVSEDVRFIYT
jgi:hypothetical protein